MSDQDEGMAGEYVRDGGTIAAHTADLKVCLWCTGDATRRLVDGEMVTVDGALGSVTAVR
ncbi:MAG: hypothetical protein M3143_01950 [Actinomycetota bacterium]|nr:hypothetical protein [Actinomycetota bacterium]